MSQRVAAIHQPNYLPWVGYFHKIHRSDVFVFLDDVEFTSGSWINRNRVKTPDGWMWLTVPVRDTGGPIHETQTVTQEDWPTEHRKTISHNYGSADYYDTFGPFVTTTYDREWPYLYDLNRHILEGLCDRVRIEYEFVESSTFDVEAQASRRLAKLCQSVGADTYLCGLGSDGYLEECPFEEEGIAVVYQDFEHPRYEQRFGEFVPNLSFLDMVMNVGPDTARDTLSSLGTSPNRP